MDRLIRLRLISNTLIVCTQVIWIIQSVSFSLCISDFAFLGPARAATAPFNSLRSYRTVQYNRTVRLAPIDFANRATATTRTQSQLQTSEEVRAT